MSWKNENISMPQQMDTYIYDLRRRNTSITMYRSRSIIRERYIEDMLVPLSLAETLTNNRMSEVYNINIVAMPKNDTAEEKAQCILDRLSNTASMYSEEPHNILIVKTDLTEENNAEVINYLVENRGMVEKDFRTALVCNPYHYVHVLHSTSINERIVIITNELKEDLFIKLGAVLPIVYGVQIDPRFTDAFLQLDKQLYIDTFMDVYTAYVKEKDARETVEALKKCAKYLSEVPQQQVKNNITYTNNQIVTREEELRVLFNKLEEYRISEASGYWGVLSDNVTEFIDYIKEYSLKDITKLRMQDSALLVALRTQLLYWDEEQYKCYATSNSPNVVTNASKEIRVLLDNIFLDRSVVVNFHTGIRIQFSANIPERYRDIISSGSNHDTLGLQHPHIYYYNCWGDNKNPISKSLRSTNYTVAWEQIKATLSGLNLSDYTVFNKFVIDQIYARFNDCNALTLADTGEVLSVPEFTARYPEGYAPGTLAIAPSKPVAVTQPQAPHVPDEMEFEVDDDDDEEEDDWE